MASVSSRLEVTTARQPPLLRRSDFSSAGVISTDAEPNRLSGMPCHRLTKLWVIGRDRPVGVHLRAVLDEDLAGAGQMVLPLTAHQRDDHDVLAVSVDRPGAGEHDLLDRGVVAHLLEHGALVAGQGVVVRADRERPPVVELRRPTVLHPEPLPGQRDVRSRRCRRTAADREAAAPVVVAGDPDEVALELIDGRSRHQRR